MKMEHSEQIPQLDDDIWDYIRICMQETTMTMGGG